jgi:glycosyltransferase involved in cell wall biosynthesis
MAIKNVLRPVKHAIWPSLGHVKRTLVLTLIRLRYLVRGLPQLPSLEREGQSDPSRRHRFVVGIVTGYRRQRMRLWNVLHYRTTVVVVINGDDLRPDANAWFTRVKRVLGAAVMIHRATDGGLAEALTHAAVVTSTKPSRFQREVLRLFPSHDVILVDAREPYPVVDELVALKYVAYRYPGHERIGVVAPSRRDATGLLRSGVDYDRSTRDWIPDDAASVRDYGQSLIPRYVLADQAHGLYLKSSFVAQVPAEADDSTGWDDLCARWIATGWRHGHRTLLFAPAIVTTTSWTLPPTDLADGWLDEREVRNADGRIRVIFVLPATSLSGGIRAVLEMGEGLSHRDFDVEIWALQGQPTWTEIALKVVQFTGYDSLLDALSAEKAIKVATWWETGQAVWLSAVNAGIPFQYVQEFETWFYPDDSVAQATVVSSYRREFIYTTIAEYQQEELREIGINAEHIPSAFDDEVFKVRPEIDRRSDTVLALGRSFFQKNFALTLAAWRSLGDRRPRLSLFGIEPGIAIDPRVTYSFRPTDEEVAVLYNEATCFVQTSRHEGFCLPLIEAMASGCPVITTDSHGNAFCIDNVNCLMVEQDDQKGVADAIARLIGDPELQERLRAAALETAEDYSWPRILAKTTAFYSQVADQFQPGVAAKA